MGGPVRDGQVLDGKAGEVTFEGLKDLVSKFLRGEKDELNVTFDKNYPKLTRYEFNELLGGYNFGGYDPMSTFINDALIYKGTYTYVDDKEVASDRHILTAKIVRIFFHKEENNGMTLYAIHQIKGSTMVAGIKIEDYD